MFLLRDELKAGKFIYCMLDPDKDLPINPNLLRLAARVSASVFVASMKLGKSTIQVNLTPAPRRVQRNEVDVRTNVDAVEAVRQDWVRLGDLEAA